MNFFALSEALIKIPAVMLTQCRDIIVAEVLGCINKLLHDKRRKFPQHALAFNNAKEKYHVKPGKFNGENVVHEIDYNINDLPTSVRNAFKHDKLILMLYFDWKGTVLTKSTAMYTEAYETIAINPRRVLKYLSSDPSDINYFIDSLVNDVRHEMMHMVQRQSLQHIDPRQVEMRPNYKNRSKDNNKDYYNSPIEFYPQIDSAVDDFNNLMKLVKMDKNKAFRIYVGLEKPSYLSGMQPSPFFLALKDEPLRYRKAISEFFKAI